MLISKRGGGDSLLFVQIGVFNVGLVGRVGNVDHGDVIDGVDDVIAEDGDGRLLRHENHVVAFGELDEPDENETGNFAHDHVARVCRRTARLIVIDVDHVDQVFDFVTIVFVLKIS